MRTPEFEQTLANNLEALNAIKPSLETIRELRKRGWIKDNGSPHWWSTDYAPDPREYLPFEEFKKRLVYLGKHEVVNESSCYSERRQKQVYLYPYPTVPIAVINLEVNDQFLPFMVTVRPCHPRELTSPCFQRWDEEWKKSLEPDFTLIQDLKESAQRGQAIKLPCHLFPHIRGLFVGARGTHLFWYSLWGNSSCNKIQESLKKIGFDFLDIYNWTYSDKRTYEEVQWELRGKGVNGLSPVELKKPVPPKLPFKEVSCDEFLALQGTNLDLLLLYPLRLPDFQETLPLAISTKTHLESKIRKPVVLGIYSTRNDSRKRRGTIWRIRDIEFARRVSQAISTDFGIPVDAVLFTPQKGRPRYERISPST